MVLLKQRNSLQCSVLNNWKPGARCVTWCHQRKKSKHWMCEFPVQACPEYSNPVRKAAFQPNSSGLEQGIRRKSETLHTYQNHDLTWSIKNDSYISRVGSKTEETRIELTAPGHPCLQTFWPNFSFNDFPWYLHFFPHFVPTKQWKGINKKFAYFWSGKACFEK